MLSIPRDLKMAAVGFCTILTAQCADADMAAPETDSALTLVGSNVVRYPGRYTELSRYIVKGVRDANGGCAFTTDVKLKDGEVIFESVREIDPVNCISIVARHPMSEAPAHARVKPRERSSTSMNLGNDAIRMSEDVQTAQLSEELWRPAGGVGLNMQSECSTQFWYDLGLFQNLWHDDPAALWVTKSDHRSYYFFDGVCVQYVHHTSSVGWRYGTGWRLVDHQVSITPVNFDWTQLNADAFSTMQNPIFCALSSEATWVQYWPSKIRHWYNGYYSFYWAWYWSGGCSSWLTPYRIAGQW